MSVTYVPKGARWVGEEFVIPNPRLGGLFKITIAEIEEEVMMPRLLTRIKKDFKGIVPYQSMGCNPEQFQDSVFSRMRDLQLAVWFFMEEKSDLLTKAGVNYFLHRYPVLTTVRYYEGKFYKEAFTSGLLLNPGDRIIFPHNEFSCY